MAENLPDTNVGNIEYIRKDAALDALKAQADSMYKWADRYAEQRRGILTAVNIIEDVEPAPVVPVVHGHWIDKNGNIVAPFWERYECSICGARSDNSNFCPNCGAKMCKE